MIIAERPSLYDLNQPELLEHLDGQPAFRVKQLWEGLYTHGKSIEDISNIPLALRDELASTLPPSLEEVVKLQGDGGTTVKWMWNLADDNRIETVLMHYATRSTVCISSQAGCAMACGFCATGQAGFDRHLTVGEMVEQVARAKREAGDRRLSNVVFMGMGEPMANYDAVWATVERLHGAFGISARHLTISTVGVVPGILRMAEEALPVNLAVSLHAANDELRTELVPLNKRYPLDTLADACRRYLNAKGRRLSFEWAMIDGVNDRPNDARELAAYARPLAAHVNLIPLNPTPGYSTTGSPLAHVKSFRDTLESLGVNATVRQNRGTDIDAACGQLVAAPRLSQDRA